MPPKQMLVAIVALMSGLAAYVFVTRGVPHRIGPEDADYFCYELHKGWVCMYARGDCETRQALEQQADIEKRCQPHYIDVPSP
jgi:hypothetical protein